MFGYLAQELISSSIKDYIHPEDYMALKNTLLESKLRNNFKNIFIYSYLNFQAVKSKQRLKTEPYRFRMKNLEYVGVETTFNALFNPFNNKIEYIVAQNKRFQLSIPYSTNSAFNPISAKSKFNCKHFN